MMGILRNVSSTYLRPELDETFFENRKVLQALMTGAVDHALVPPENEAEILGDAVKFPKLQTFYPLFPNL